MTSPSASRPGSASAAPLRPSTEPGGRVVAEPPSGAVSLAELVAESGPLPPDAVLECVQRLAERLARCPDAGARPLAPADVYLDDDGGVWLTDFRIAEPCASCESDAMERLGRLAAFLATGESGHLTPGLALAPAGLPNPVNRVAGRLFSKNGTGYHSYAELARDAAALRGGSVPEIPAVEAEPDAGVTAPATAPPEATAPAAEIVPPADSRAAADDELTPIATVSRVGWLIGVALAAAAVAVATWFALSSG